jgi:hypothetical protein
MMGFKVENTKDYLIIKPTLFSGFLGHRFYLKKSLIIGKKIVLFDEVKKKEIFFEK